LYSNTRLAIPCRNREGLSGDVVYTFFLNAIAATLDFTRAETRRDKQIADAAVEFAFWQASGNRVKRTQAWLRLVDAIVATGREIEPTKPPEPWDMYDADYWYCMSCQARQYSAPVKPCPRCASETI